MNTLATSIIIVVSLLRGFTPHNRTDYLPPEDRVVTPVILQYYLPVLLKPGDNNVPVLVEDESIVEFTPIVELPNEPMVDVLTDSDCPGGYETYGPHPCPNNDNAEPNPNPPNNH